MIGGEFEIDLSQRCGFTSQPDTFYYSSGRAALYQILLTLASRHKMVWMPDWLCYSMVEAVKQAGYGAQFYELNERLEASTDALERCGFDDGDVVLIVNYFGLQDLSLVSKKIKTVYPTAVVIEDDVQAYWFFAEKENPYADYRFTSLRKAFAVPDGGLVKTNHPMPSVNRHNTFTSYKLDAAIMKSMRGRKGVRDEDYLRLFKLGEDAISNNYDSEMSEVAKSLFAGTDLRFAKERRQHNAKVLVEGLLSLGLRPLIDFPCDCVPLFIPVYLENRDEVRRKMFQKEVFCPVHWPLEGMNVKYGSVMAEHELSLIVDQRYDETDMKFIIDLL